MFGFSLNDQLEDALLDMDSLDAGKIIGCFYAGKFLFEKAIFNLKKKNEAIATSTTRL